MGTVLTYNDGNLLESVTRMVINISPTDTPVMSSIGKTKAIQTLHQWPEDSLASRGSNATVEGTTITYGTRTAPARRTNYTQFMTKEYSVSSSDINSKGAGVDDMFIYQKGKALKELSNDMEWNLINATSSAGTTVAARQMGGLLQFITTNATTYASTVKMVETMFISLLQAAWAAGGNPNVAWVGSYMKRAITAFTAQNTRWISANDNKLVSNVQIYESPFGVVDVELSRDIPNATATARVVVAEREKVAMSILIPVTVKDPTEVAQTIYGMNGYVETEVSLQITEKACAQAIGMDIAL